MAKICPDLPLLFEMHEIWPDDSQENYLNCCDQMSDFKAKMHQIRFWLGIHPRTRWGSLPRSPRPPSWIKGGLLLREVEGREGRVVGA